jgi:hypothetical protein
VVLIGLAYKHNTGSAGESLAILFLLTPHADYELAVRE